MENLMHIIREIILNYGYFGIFSLTAADQFILPIPTEVYMAIGSAAGLPFVKIAISVFSATLVGSCIGYFLGKKLGNPVMNRLFGKQKLEKIEAFVKNYGMWGVMFIGLSSLFPFKAITWAAGIFGVPFGSFVLGVILGRFPHYLITGYAASLIVKTKIYASVKMSAVILGATQGLTEFLPISSSGHLAVLENFLKLPPHITAKNLEIFDIFLHGGSLLAVIIYFWRDWVCVLKESWHIVTKLKFDKNTLTAKLIIGTLPAIFVALMFKDAIGNQLRHIYFIAAFFIANALFYLYAEWKGKDNKREDINIKNSFIVGVAQAAALVPSISRSGATLATGMVLGLKRGAAARFSFMLGGVALLAANVYALFSLRNHPVMPDISFTLIGTSVSFIVSLVSMSWLLKFLEKHTLRPFSFYLLVLGSLIFMVF